MNNTKGFALAVTLLFLLLMTLFGFSVLMLAGNYYASARNFFEKENARIACNQAIRLMIDRHNLDNAPQRFFVDPRIWQGTRMTPFLWNDHEITASLAKPWSGAEPNELTTASRKGRYAASRLAQIRQRRMEDFALYLDDSAELTGASLFDGPVFTRSGLRLDVPGTRFRATVQGTVEPKEFTTFRKENLQILAYPEAAPFVGATFFRDEARSKGLVVAPRHPAFWRTSRYELNLDLLELEKQPRNRWRLRYDGLDLGIASEPLLWFDDSVAVSQPASPPVFLITKPSVPIYIASAADILILTSLHPPEDVSYRHPVALAAEDALYIDSSAPRALCLEALLIGLGSDPFDDSQHSLFIEPGGQPLTADQLTWFRSEILSSAFLLEEERRNAVLAALEGGERIVWFRGGLVLSKTWKEPDGPVQIHFQGGADSFPLLPALPFVYMVEGREQWL